MAKQINIETISLKAIPAKITRAHVTMESIVNKVGEIPRKNAGRDGERYHEAKVLLRTLEKAFVRKTREAKKAEIQKLRDKASELREWIRENKASLGKESAAVLNRKNKLASLKLEIASVGAKHRAEKKPRKAAEPRRAAKVTAKRNATPAARVSKQEKAALAEKRTNGAKKANGAKGPIVVQSAGRKRPLKKNGAVTAKNGNGVKSAATITVASRAQKRKVR